MWFHLVMVTCAAVLAATSAAASRSSAPTHPMVERHSVAGAWFFAASTLGYAASAVFLVRGATGPSVACGLAGLVLYAAGYVAARS